MSVTYSMLESARSKITAARDTISRLKMMNADDAPPEILQEIIHHLLDAEDSIEEITTKIPENKRE